MSELDRAANPTIEEAIKYLEGMIFTQDFHPSTLRAKAVNTMAIAALREQQAREKGCDYCGLIYKLDGASYGTDSVIIKNRFCPMCGKRLEAQHEQ
jgi:hypothetical protein